MTKLVEATQAQQSHIVRFLSNMILEVEEFDPSAVQTVEPSVRASFNEGVFWFLFEDEKGVPFGTCYLQSVYSYWRMEKRYYLGGMYIQPEHRGEKRFAAIYEQLKAWAQAHDGGQIFCSIDQANPRSIKAFAKAGFEQSYCNLYMDNFA